MDMEFRHVSESISYCVSVTYWFCSLSLLLQLCVRQADNELAWCKDTLQVAWPARTILRPKQCSTRLSVQSRSSTWLESLKRETPTVQRQAETCTLADSTRLLFCSFYHQLWYLLFIVIFIVVVCDCIFYYWLTVIFVINRPFYHSFWLYLRYI